MIALHPLNSINLLSFLAKRASSGLLAQTHLDFYLNREISSRMMATEDRDGDIEGDNNGRIWVHRPFQIAPTTHSLVNSDTPVITTCPLPKTTPHSAPKDKLYCAFSSSPTPEMFLEQIYQSKVEFYESQFQSRVAKEAWERIERRVIQSPRGLGEVDATIYFPEKSDISDARSPKLQGICLHVHGGGWLWGDSYHQVAHRCLEMAKSMNVAVVSVEYSLFSQVNRHCDGSNNSNTFDPVNDVSIAIDWIESNGARELNASPSFVASGESSGAHLLLLAMLKRRDRDNIALHPPLPLPPMKHSSTAQPSVSSSLNWKCLNLVYGVYDISGTPSLRSDGNSSSPLCGNDLLWLYDLYYSKITNSMQDTNDNASAKQTNIGRHHPSLSPLYSNLSHMPPALLSVGTADPLMDDTLFMANKYSAFGNHVELAVFEGGEHGLGHFGVQEDEEMGIRARTHTLDFMKEYLQSE